MLQCPHNKQQEILYLGGAGCEGLGKLAKGPASFSVLGDNQNTFISAQECKARLGFEPAGDSTELAVTELSGCLAIALLERKAGTLGNPCLPIHATVQ